MAKAKPSFEPPPVVRAPEHLGRVAVRQLDRRFGVEVAAGEGFAYGLEVVIDEAALREHVAACQELLEGTAS